MKKTLAIILSLVMLMSAFSIIVTATDGTVSTNAIEIDSAEDLANIPETGLDKDYILTADITVTDDTYTPIGDYTNRFKGTFDGNNKTITVDITYSDKTFTTANTMTDAKYVGLFGATEDATIKNLTVKGEMTVSVAYGCIGGVVGAAFGETTLKNIVTDLDMLVTLDDENSATSNLASNVGGVVGRIHRKNAETTTMTTVTVEDVYTFGDLNVDDNEETSSTASPSGTDYEYLYGVAGSPIGGIIGMVGHLVDLQITRCVNLADISVDLNGGNVGGIIGMNSYKVNNANPTKADLKITMTWCGNHGDIFRGFDNGERISPLIACMQGNVAIENCYNTGKLSDTTGGFNPQADTNLIGFFGNVSSCYAMNCFSTQFVDVFALKYSDANRAVQAKFTKNFVTADCTNPAGSTKLGFTAGAPAEIVYAALLEKYEGEEMAAKLAVRTLDGEAVVGFNFIPELTSDADVIEIDSAEEFAKIGNDASYPLNGSYKLTADISTGSTMIGSYDAPFTGTFDGNGKTVTVDIDYTDLETANNIKNSAKVGLFACVKGATICDLNVKGTLDATTVCGFFGGLVALSIGETTVYGCDVDVDMTLVLDGAAKPALAERPVTGTDGETGEPTYGDAPAKDYVSIIGGVVGLFHHNAGDIFQEANVHNSVNRGDIKVTTAAEKAKSTGNTFNVGGSGAYGGIVGASGFSNAKGVMNIKITDCINYGDISVNKGAQNIGGILGMTSTSGISMATIYRSANYGDLSREVSSGDRVVAIFGYSRYCDVQYCFNTGDVSASSTSFIGFSTKFNRNHYNFSLTKTGAFKDGKGEKINSSMGNVWLSDQTVNTAATTGSALEVGSDATALEIVNAHLAAFKTDAVMSELFKAYGIYDTVKDTGINIGFSAPTGVTFYGYQTTDATEGENGTYNIRFVALVDSLAYDKIGYDIKGTYYDAQKGKNVTLSWNKECGMVYTSLTGSVDGTEAVYNVVGDYYIMALAITGVPTNVGEITFEVTPYSIDDEVKTSGETKTVVYTPVTSSVTE